jgi:hypothetical protein
MIASNAKARQNHAIIRIAAYFVTQSFAVSTWKLWAIC